MIGMNCMNRDPQLVAQEPVDLERVVRVAPMERGERVVLDAVGAQPVQARA